MTLIILGLLLGLGGLVSIGLVSSIQDHTARKHSRGSGEDARSEAWKAKASVRPKAA